MPCIHTHEFGGCVTICQTPPMYIRRRIRRCPTCKRRRRFVDESFEWYGPKATCCACGDSWGEDGRYPRPFMRGWRTPAVARARQLWSVA